MEYRGYKIESDGTFGMKFIKTIGRGSLPNSLKGRFSNTREAEKAIDAIVNRKVEKDGEGSGSGRG